MKRPQSLADIATEPSFRTIAGVSIRFAESEPRDVHALLLCPWPESVFAYEAVWPQLAETAHLVAVDLPGFGRSERRNDLMSPSAMGDFIVRVADAFHLERPHVVGPDIGTSAALFAAAANPGRFLSLSIGAGGAAIPLELGEPLRTWVQAPDLEPYRQIGGRPIVERVLETIESHKVTDAARRDYLASYDGDRFAESMRYVQSYPTELMALRDVLSQVVVPVQIISGSRDAVVPLVNARFLDARLPYSELCVVDAGHFIWEEAATRYANLVNEWWAGGFSRCLQKPMKSSVES
jgi:pimeloyl-ACP methyl ester carboxylesterase